jgi:acyl dehydratase
MKLDAVIKRVFPPVRQEYTAKDTILYALGVGAGAEPTNPSDLPFVYERTLKIIPAQASVLCYPGPWLAESALGIDYVRLLHGEQGIIFERPLKPSGKIRGEYEILAVDDKGEEKGAVIFFEKRILDDEDGEVICRVRSTYFCRADGGCGSWGTPLDPPGMMPDRAPDKVVDVPTIARQALIYRLSGDYNPVHIDPEVAGRAGFKTPILHGLCTYGIACFAFVQEVCGGDPNRIAEIFTRFSRPVLPGDLVRIEFFDEGAVWRFRARVVARDEVVLDRGLIRVK